MNFNKHSELEGRHAFLSASQGAWINDNSKEIIQRYLSVKAKERGTELHEFAKEAIRLNIQLAKNHKTLNLFVNDAIGFRMIPEQPLYYSPFAFGTADAISYDEKKKILRIHDLKTGKSGEFRQLELYAAYFCLEYKINPEDIKDIILRIYRDDNFEECHPERKIIRNHMNIIVSHNKILYKFEGYNGNEEEILEKEE